MKRRSFLKGIVAIVGSAVTNSRVSIATNFKKFKNPGLYRALDEYLVTDDNSCYFWKGNMPWPKGFCWGSTSQSAFVDCPAGTLLGTIYAGKASIKMPKALYDGATGKRVPLRSV